MRSQLLRKRERKREIDDVFRLFSLILAETPFYFRIALRIYRVVTVTALARAMAKLISAEIAILAACASKRGAYPVDSAWIVRLSFYGASARSPNSFICHRYTAYRVQPMSKSGALADSRHFGIKGQPRLRAPGDRGNRVPLFHNSARNLRAATTFSWLYLATVGIFFFFFLSPPTCISRHQAPFYCDLQSVRI